jgi:uncharacterized protein YcbK (DUF882 family)
MTARRRFLKSAVLVGAGCLLPALAKGATVQRADKSLRFYHTHTGEALNRVFWTNGEYVPGALADINRLLRDHRTNEVLPIDPQLLSLLERITSLTGKNDTLHVISGYRSPVTNRTLADRSDDVSRRSLHMDGKAIDIRIPGRDLQTLRNAALSLRGGGVGFYPHSQFVHVDIGRVRAW